MCVYVCVGLGSYRGLVGIVRWRTVKWVGGGGGGGGVCDNYGGILWDTNSRNDLTILHITSRSYLPNITNYAAIKVQCLRKEGNIQKQKQIFEKKEIKIQVMNKIASAKKPTNVLSDS